MPRSPRHSIFPLRPPGPSRPVPTPGPPAVRQTPDTLSLTTTRPPPEGKNPPGTRAGNFPAEPLARDGKVTATDKRDVGSHKEAKPLRLESAAPKAPADQVT